MANKQWWQVDYMGGDLRHFDHFPTAEEIFKASPYGKTVEEVLAVVEQVGPFWEDDGK
jgi:hypothetical protein